jgi:DNA-binding PucR family transcriptional regulator
MTWWQRCPSSCGASAELARSSHTRRFEVVSLILESAPITTGRAGTQLGYDLRRRHTAAVLWTDPRRPDQAALARAADALGPATGARQVLTVIASSSSVWAWLAAAADTDAAAITAATAAHPGVRIAVGPAGPGVDGFRASHFDIREQFSAARAARALYSHRNTVLNRLQRAEGLLPHPLAGHGLEVGVALEIAQWLGTPPGSATRAG